MSVSNGQKADENTFNNAFMSRTTDTDTIGKVDLNNADSAAITDVQQQINDNIGNIATNTTNIATNASDITALDVRVTQNENDLSNINGNFVDLTTNQTIAGEKTFSNNVVMNGDLEVNGTTTTVNSQELDVTDSNITVNNGGTDASSEGAGVTVDRVGTDGSISYENALDNRFKVGDAGSEVEISGVIKDTEANILAIVSPSTSQKYYATDTGKYFVYDAVKSAFLELGSGSGIGSPSIYGLFNAENEDLTGFLGASINSVSPIAGEFSYNLTFPGNAPSVDVQERSQNKLNQLNLQAKITSGVCKFIVKDQSSNILAEVEYDGSKPDLALQYFLPDTVTSTQLFWEDVSSATGAVADDIYSDDNPLNFRETVEEIQYLKCEGNAGETITANVTNIPFLEVSDPQSLFNGSEFTIPENGVYTHNFGVFFTASVNTTIFLYIDGVQEKSVTTNATQSIHKGSFTGEFTKGQVVSFRADNGGTLSNNSVRHYYEVTRVKDSVGLVTSDSGTENVFSARIENNGTATVTSESSPFIDTVNRDSLGKVTVNFKTGFFTEIPAISLTTDDGPVTSVIITPANTPTTSSVQIETWNEGAGAYQDRDFVIKVQRQGDDYKDPHAFNLVQLQDQNENTFGAQIANNGTATVTSQSGNWIQSVNRVAVGTVDITHNPGIFTQALAAVATCSDNTDIACLIDDANSSATVTRVLTRNFSGVLFDREFHIVATKQGADYVPPSGVSAGPMQAVAVAHIWDEKPSSTNGQSISSGSAVTRDLNQISGSGFASLNSSQITLQGKAEYEIEVEVPGFRCNRHQSTLYSITDAAIVKVGSSAYSANAVGGATTHSKIKHKLSIDSTKIYEIRHEVETTDVAAGGVASGFGNIETYTQVTIRKLR